MKKLLTLTVAVIVISIFLGLMPVHGESEIYDSVIRLHVIANSDSDEDQRLKLSVRDEILVKVADITARCDTLDEARTAVQMNLDEIEKIAADRVEKEGYKYDVCVELGEERYPTKSYESFCFPSGEYLSLQVKIGEAQGQNWWCVLFPPMCVSAASVKSSEDALINVGLSGQQYKIITDSHNTTYNVRFKILETIEEIVS